MFSARVERVVKAITDNEKRMAKLRSCGHTIDRRMKAHAFVVAECAAQKIKLSDDEIASASHHVWCAA